VSLLQSQPPEPPQVTRSLLDNAGVEVENVNQADLPALGIIATPTILVVNSKGVVIHQFVGRLSDREERRMTSLLYTSSGTGQR